jgi:CBS domain-containing protein
MKVADCMTPDPLVIDTGEPVKRIAELIRFHGILQVPVVDLAQRLVGIVTDRDVRAALGTAEDEAPELTAEDIMTQDVITIIPGAELVEAVELLIRHGFGALPVVVGDHVVGLLRTVDLLGRMKEMLEAGYPLALDSRARPQRLAAARSLDTFEADIL